MTTSRGNEGRNNPKRRKIVKMPMMLALMALGTGLTGLFPAISAAETYPSRPISIIVPFPPGGVADLTARPLALGLEKVLKTPVVIVNKAGAAGAVGMQSAAVSKPDGYTLLSALVSISVIPEVDTLFGRPKTYKREDFAPIALLSADPMIVVVKKESPYKTVADIVADAKKRPGEILYSSSGIYGATHVPTEMFADAAGIKMRHIPTAGGGPALTALLGNHVQLLFSVPIIANAQIKSGELRPLAVTSEKRLAAFPEVPTLKELGYDVEYYIWCGIFAPKAVPQDIIKILREAIRKVVVIPEFKTAMEKMSTPIDYRDADEFQKFWDKDAERLIKTIHHIGKVQ
jgi:tripartite-type tricarboxylate transporter receptor subunit TctC